MSDLLKNLGDVLRGLGPTGLLCVLWTVVICTFFFQEKVDIASPSWWRLWDDFYWTWVVIAAAGVVTKLLGTAAALRNEKKKLLPDEPVLEVTLVDDTVRTSTAPAPLDRNPRI